LTLGGGLAGPTRLLTRTVLGAALIYGLSEVAGELVRLLHLIAGIEVQPLHRTPIAARSITEFWGRRWNLLVNQWLNEIVFRPLARLKHPAIGLVAAFGASAAIHGWMYAPIGVQAVMMIMAFFLVQAAIVLVESRLNVRAWPRPAAHAWTMGGILIPLPLLTEPAFAAFGW
jgi:Membrane bound O-acyl transferase family